MSGLPQNPHVGRVQDFSNEGMQLVRLAADGETEAVCAAIDSGKVPVDARGLNETTALMMACKGGFTDLVHELLNRGADAQACDFDGKSCLRYAVDTRAWKARENMVGALLDSGADCHKPDMRGVVVLQRADNDSAKQMARHLTIRPYSDDISLSKEEIFAGNDAKPPMLHSPSLWHHWDAVVEKLGKKGERLEKADILAPDAMGVVPMERAVHCRAFGAVKDTLLKQGEPLEPKDMLDGAEPAGWVNALAETHQLGALFTQDVWQEHGAQAMSRVYNALDANAKEQVPNYHQLRQELTLESQSQGRGR